LGRTRHRRGSFSPHAKPSRHTQSTFHELWIEHAPTPIKQACPTFHEKWDELCSTKNPPRPAQSTFHEKWINSNSIVKDQSCNQHYKEQITRGTFTAGMVYRLAIKRDM
jgi:hypothetical protein